MPPFDDPPLPRVDLVVRPLRPTETELVPSLWNAAWEPHHGGSGSRYPLEDDVWRDRLSLHHDPELLLGAFDGDRCVGVGYGRAATAPWLAQDAGWLSLVATLPDRQGHGVGTTLARTLADLLRVRGCRTLRFGGEANHLLPGIPQEAPAAAWRLARRLGARFGNVEHDLHLDLRADLPLAPLASGWHLRDDDPEAAVAFVERAFPGRWAHEVRHYVHAGAAVLTLAPDGSDDGPASARAEGFCVVFQGDEGVRGPSLTWVPPASLVSRSGGLAGMGPLGVSDAARGQGLGLGLVRASAAWLAERGATGVIINWTTLTGFYGRLGARVHRSYQRAEAPLSSASPDESREKAEASR
ncbi:MAG: GNAT family N-acetyltransferase [Trueperaceae bacterium]